MQINHVFSCRIPKESESITDCQDYFQLNETTRCFAIADGASQSFYPSIWAELLVNHFCQNPEINQMNWKQWLESIQEKWLLEVKNRAEKAKSQKKSTWIESYNGLNTGRASTSTFVGLQFTEDRVKVSIVGDSCLFVLEDRRLETYLLKSSKDFNDRPEYFASYDKDNHFQPQFLDLPLNNAPQSDVYFVLATDALSEYIFKSIEVENNIFQKLLKISSQKDFEDFVASARHDSIGMKNDDVTLVTLYLNNKNLPEITKQSENRAALVSENSLAIDLSNNESALAIENSQATNLSSNEIEYPENPSSHVKKNIKENANLKRQRAILGFLLLGSLLSNIIQFNQSKPSITELPKPIPASPPNPTEDPKSKEFVIKKGITIYKDEALSKILVESSANPIKALIIAEKDNLIKFQTDLYAHSTTSANKSCKDNEIEFNGNLRVSPNSANNQNTLGKLKEKTKFKNIEPNATEWCKFRFVGYTKK